MRLNPYSLDTAGLSFTVKCALGVLCLATVAHYGVAFVARPEVPSRASALAAARESVSRTQTQSVVPDAPVRFVVNGSPLPKVTASAYLVGDIESGVVFASKDGDIPRPIASLTKLLTAIVAKKTIPRDAPIKITSDDRRQTEGTPGSIGPNNTFSAEDLLYPLLMESNNSVAFALSRFASSTVFIETMNREARAIGMRNTVIEDPSGLSARNAAAPRDIFALTRYLLSNEQEFFGITREKQRTITALNGRRYTIPNFNVFAGNPEFLGGKTGYTDEAGETMTAVFEVPLDGDVATVAIIVLDSADRKRDVEKLLTWFKASARTEE